MIGTREKKINFKQISLSDKPVYEKYLAQSGVRGCEFSFANLYLWGRQNIAVTDEAILIFSQFNRRSIYPYPLGSHDVHAALDAIIDDARARGIACRISGITEDAKATLEEFYPEKFRYHTDEGSFDYVYSVDDLADLPGKKYDGKRNHIRRFCDAFPDYTAEPISDDNTAEVSAFVENWYERRLADNPDADFHMERAALTRALANREALELEGLVIRGGGEILAMTLASRLSPDTFDVNFEKARGDIQGAYAVINCEFAKYIRKNHPEICYLDREEDMGLEGLRRAKRSYHPHHMIKKYWACLLEECYDY
ncbi:MAG: DUF2156 domain-containing protein [Clostridia bacterium]|nr:DUF2156 domain-containing protein [Clostridia bacterium]